MFLYLYRQPQKRATTMNSIYVFPQAPVLTINSEPVTFRVIQSIDKKYIKLPAKGSLEDAALVLSDRKSTGRTVGVFLEGAQTKHPKVADLQLKLTTLELYDTDRNGYVETIIGQSASGSKGWFLINLDKKKVTPINVGID
jgi:hypothetical protein